MRAMAKEPVLEDCLRDVLQRFLLGHTVDETYTKPKPIRQQIPTLRAKVILRSHKKIMGRMAMTKSHAAPNAE